MIAILGAICATLLGLRRWVPDYDRLITETEWQGGPYQSWIPLSMPVTYNYEAAHIGNEIFLFVFALVVAWWCFRNRNDPLEKSSARIFLAISAVTIIFFAMLWLGRQHVEGDWKAVPPHLIRRVVETPEYLAEKARREAFWQAEANVRNGLTPEGVKIWHKVCIYY